MPDEPKQRKKSRWKWILLVFGLCVLLMMLAVMFPLWGLISSRVKVNATDALVQSIANAITTYQVKTWRWNEGTTSEPRFREYHIFDLNQDHFIDGYPATTASETQDGGFPAAVIESGYTGFISMAQPQIKKSFLSKSGVPLDAWGRPLRIAFAAKVYGNVGFGVWSAGPDGKDGTPDDLQSWALIALESAVAP